MTLGTLVGLLLHRLGRKMATFRDQRHHARLGHPGADRHHRLDVDLRRTSGLVTWPFNALPDRLSSLLFGRFDWTGYGLVERPVHLFLDPDPRGGLGLVPVHRGLGAGRVEEHPKELYEAARVDGASAWRIFWTITFPLLRPVFGILMVLSTIWDFKVFTQQFVLAGGTQDRSTFMLSIYSYAEAFSPPPKYGLGSAIAVILTVILLVVTALYVRMVLRQEDVSMKKLDAIRNRGLGARSERRGDRGVPLRHLPRLLDDRAPRFKPNREIFSATASPGAGRAHAGALPGILTGT